MPLKTTNLLFVLALGSADALKSTTTCFGRARGACADVGVAKGISSAATCQVQCLSMPDCKRVSRVDESRRRRGRDADIP